MYLSLFTKQNQPEYCPRCLSLLKLLLIFSFFQFDNNFYFSAQYFAAEQLFLFYVMVTSLALFANNIEKCPWRCLNLWYWSKPGDGGCRPGRTVHSAHRSYKVTKNINLQDLFMKSRIINMVVAAKRIVWDWCSLDLSSLLIGDWLIDFYSYVSKIKIFLVLSSL